MHILHKQCNESYALKTKWLGIIKKVYNILNSQGTEIMG